MFTDNKKRGSTVSMERIKVSEKIDNSHMSHENKHNQTEFTETSFLFTIYFLTLTSIHHDYTHKVTMVIKELNSTTPQS